MFKKSIALMICLFGMALFAGQVPVAKVLQAIQAQAEFVKLAEETVHTTALAWYGAASTAALLVTILVIARRRLRHPIPRCLLLGAFGAGCWLVGAWIDTSWLTLVGIGFLSLAHVCECTHRLGSLIWQSFR